MQAISHASAKTLTNKNSDLVKYSGTKLKVYAGVKNSINRVIE